MSDDISFSAAVVVEMGERYYGFFDDILVFVTIMANLKVI